MDLKGPLEIIKSDTFKSEYKNQDPWATTK